MRRLSRRPRKYAVLIRVVGFVGAKTARAIMNAEAALEGNHLVGVEWISDPHAMSRLGSLQLPAMFVNDTLRVAGRIPSVHEVRTWINEVLQETEATYG